MYVNGQHEAWSAKANWKSQGLTLATKVWPTSFGVCFLYRPFAVTKTDTVSQVYAETPGMHTPAELRKHFGTSLRELEIDCVEIWYLHAPDRSVPFKDTTREVNELYKEGKFKKPSLFELPCLGGG